MFFLLISLSAKKAQADGAREGFACFAGVIGKLFRTHQPVNIVKPVNAPPVNLITEESWANSKKLLVAGTDKSLSFSYDGELPWDELLKFAKGDEEAMAAIHELFGTERYTKAEILKKLNLSDKQFDSFVIRPASELGKKDSWMLTELPPRYFALMIEGRYGKALHEKPIDTMAKAVEKLLAKHGYNVSGHSDTGFVEVSHPSFDVQPSVFNGTMKSLERDFPKSTMHMHIGIPDVVTEDEATAVGRAMELRVIFSLADQPIGPKLPYIRYSPLRTLRLEKVTKKLDYWRGVTRLGLGEFRGAHNFELRQYESTDDGLDLIKFGSNLSMNPKALYKIEHFDPIRIKDPYTSNLNGALEYAGILFKNKGTPELTQLGDEMIEMAKEMEKENAINPKMRVRVQKFVEKNQIREKLSDLSLYLKMD